MHVASENEYGVLGWCLFDIWLEKGKGKGRRDLTVDFTPGTCTGSPSRRLRDASWGLSPPPRVLITIGAPTEPTLHVAITSVT